MEKTLVLNADLTYHSFITFKKVVKNLLKGTMEVFLGDKNRNPLKINGNFVPFPKVVKLMKFIRNLYGKGVFPSKKNILIRDKFVCAYCGEKATEVEHIHPKSKGGIISWENAVATCSSCNRKKGDKTLSEAKMVLKYNKPFQPTISEFVMIKVSVMGIQKMIDDFIDEAYNSQ